MGMAVQNGPHSPRLRRRIQPLQDPGQEFTHRYLKLGDATGVPKDTHHSINESSHAAESDQGFSSIIRRHGLISEAGQKPLKARQRIAQPVHQVRSHGSHRSGLGGHH